MPGEASSSRECSSSTASAGAESGPVQHEDELPVSIQSIRSKFESLSAKENRPRTLSDQRKPVATPPTNISPPSSMPQSATAPTSPNPSRRPAPAVPLKSATPAATTPVVSSVEPTVALETSAMSVRSLRERFSGNADSGPTPVVPKPPRAVAQATSVSSSGSSGVPAVKVSPPVVRQLSAPSSKGTSISGEDTTPEPEEARDPANRTPSTSPATMEQLLTAKGKTAPPPSMPRPRSPSPAPLQPNRATKPSPRVTPTVSRENSSLDLVAHRDASPSVPPTLPTRKLTISSGSTAQVPPPVPGKKPVISTSVPMVSSELGEGPPRLPERSRAQTISRTDGLGQPPRLPTRQATSLSSQSSMSPPHHSSIPSSPPRSRETTPGSGSGDSYQPPLPPMRNILNNIINLGSGSSAPAPPTGRSGASSVEMTSEDEDDGDGTPITGLTTSAKRMMDDYPDSTHANKRAPQYQPDVRLVSPHASFTFAVFGRFVCIATYHVRVFDTQMSNQPIFTIDLKETGLDFRIKEPKVTAMCFRPGATLADEGRYLWCGTKDGHLWELDVKAGIVTDTRAFAHSSAVVSIFRHGHFFLTLEEGGKLHTFEVGTSGPNGKDKDADLIPQLCRTSRISERFNFAKLVRAKLWTSSGPADRSTTNTASRGPTIRVYEPCTTGAMPPPQTLYTSEWTGAVTSATIMPLKPDEVYLGHEGGYISIWSYDDLTCLRVLKISLTDVLSLEGVGERLWVGNRKGEVHVYDISEKPWQTTNIWTAHAESPVVLLQADPWSMESTGRFTVWTCSRDSARAWDGLLAIEWIYSQMVCRQPDYCTFRDIRVLVCSWNIDSAKPSDLSGSEANALFLDQCLNSVESPDIIVFGFQEVIPLNDTKLTAKNILFGGNKKDGGGGDKVSLAYRQWVDKLQYAVRIAYSNDKPYVKVHSESLVGLFTCIFVKGSEKERLSMLDITTIKRGLGNIYGNKGAVVSRMVIDDTSICFINVHLAAGQSQKAARNADLAAIMEDKGVLPPSDELPFVRGGNGSGILDHEIVILNGDLNYRIDARRENVVSSVNAGDITSLLELDQLRKEIRSNHAFRLRSFAEAPITFAPTYKYNRGSVEYDSSEKKRVPAWCDRILHNKSDRIAPINYQRYEATVSDHRPVSAGFQVQIKSVDKEKMAQVRKEVGAGWAKREAEMLGRMVEAFGNLM